VSGKGRPASNHGVPRLAWREANDIGTFAVLSNHDLPDNKIASQAEVMSQAAAKPRRLVSEFRARLDRLPWSGWLTDKFGAG
jgi:hypothetical protein